LALNARKAITQPSIIAQSIQLKFPKLIVNISF
jgi:hypothetical protein